MRTLLAVRWLTLLVSLALFPTGVLAQATTTCRNVPYVGIECKTEADWRDALPSASRSPQRQQPQGINFGAMIRGQRQAEDDNYRDMQRQQLQMENARRHNEAAEIYARQAEVSQNELKADLYLSNISNARNQAIAGGMSPSNFWNGTYRQMLADNTFQSMPQQMQEVVIAKFKRLHSMLETKF